LPWPWRPAPSGADIAVGHRPGVSIERKRHVREGNAYRLASSLAIAGVVVVAVASRFHGGAEPQNLLSVLPKYAANPYWKAVHFGQFLGPDGQCAHTYSERPTTSVGLSARYAGHRNRHRRREQLRRQYAVDGVAIQFVARVFVEAPAHERAMALSAAEGVRHIEQGLSGRAAINLGITLALCGGAIISSRVLARWLGWAAVLVGAALLVSGVSIYSLGFSQHVLGFWAGVLLLAWMLTAAVVLWRRSSGDGDP